LADVGERCVDRFPGGGRHVPDQEQQYANRDRVEHHAKGKRRLAQATYRHP
jgi:hypothetical protein